MSMSTHIVGFRPPDSKWKRMKAVWDACDQAGVPVPDEVTQFFNGEPPDINGIEVDLKCSEACCEGGDRDRVGYTIDLEKLPPNITKIRFYNAW